ncbi:Acyl-CoA 5-desaturase AL21 [Nymphon striatum]|nr:Acyl-CoA 5-desaturase AL21 [Nymphon striatum]
MSQSSGTPRIIDTVVSSSNEGNVEWSPLKSIWYLFHSGVAIVGGYLTFSLSAVVIFVVLSGLTLCLGHSLGMHRRLIHKSYDCPLWLEYFFVYLGVLVGMAGPYGMAYQHDLRDWAQRKQQCHSFLRHGSSFWKDAWWQLNCDLTLDNPPVFELEQRLKDDKVYQFLERTWMSQQIPVAIVLFYFGGVAWAVWGISARVAVSLTGHWLVGHYAHKEDAHNGGERDWNINNAVVQGHNVRFAGLLSMGESWHNNHHAYPESAVLGIYKGQIDLGWEVLNRLTNLGLVWNVKLPKDLVVRHELEQLSASGFIGSHIKNALERDGYDVVAPSHNQADFMRLLSSDDWLPLLQNVDVVINAVGIIVETKHHSFDNLHAKAPSALFQACEQVGIKRVIQLSALGADENSYTDYQRSKYQTELTLRKVNTDWFVLRPSLVYGEGGASMRMFKQLSQLPLIVFPEGGKQWIQPVHVSDLVHAVLECLKPETPAKRVINIVGPKAIQLIDWLQLMRKVSGKQPAMVIPIPFVISKMVAMMGQYIMPIMHPDNLKMLHNSNIADVIDIEAMLGRLPLSIEDTAEELI